MHVSAQLAALIAIMSIGVIYGTDAFCALVQRPALARVDDATLTAVMGNVHRFGDRRLPVPGMLGMIASTAACVLAAIAGRAVAAATAGAALALLISWLLIYLRISAPINRALTVAADGHQTPTNARSLQHDWDRVIELATARLLVARDVPIGVRAVAEATVVRSAFGARRSGRGDRPSHGSASCSGHAQV